MFELGNPARLLTGFVFSAGISFRSLLYCFSAITTVQIATLMSHGVGLFNDVIYSFTVLLTAKTTLLLIFLFNRVSKRFSMSFSLFTVVILSTNKLFNSSIKVSVYDEFTVVLECYGMLFTFVTSSLSLCSSPSL